MDGSLKYWLALLKAKGFSKIDARRLLEGTDDIRSLFEGPSSFSLTRPEWEWVEQELKLIEKHNVQIITIKDRIYPALLKEIYDPPVLLYAKGLDAKGFFGKNPPMVAIVGTRRASHYGVSMSEAMGRDLAGAGITVVSGMARGCDSGAHRGVLKANGLTAAVLGCGVDITYPRENKRLYEEIAERGLLLSELPMSTPPLARNFPARNRIICGLSLGVVVVEAPLRSGAMMTARIALDSNREVFAMPGNAGSKTSGGTNKLIRDGAMLVENALDVINAIAPGHEIKNAATETKTINRDEGKILNLIANAPLHIDSIALKSALPIQTVSSLLLDMELKGLVGQMPGKFFVKNPVQ